MSNLTNLDILTIWLFTGLLLAFTLAALIWDAVQAHKRPQTKMVVLAAILVSALVLGPIGWFLLPFVLIGYGVGKEGSFRADHPVHAHADWHWS